MTFPKEYFYDEVREGFYISGMMKRSWAAQLEVLDEVDRVCRKYGIKWFADCGTLLGAVRHKGFIPWDDDVDLIMPRPDYMKFLNKIKNRSIYDIGVSLDKNDKILTLSTCNSGGKRRTALHDKLIK